MDKYNYLDLRFHCIYLVNKDEVIFDIKQEAIEEAESVVPSPICIIADDDDTTSHESPTPMKKLKGLAAVLVHTLSTPSEELTIDEKVMREMRRYEEYPVVSMEADPLIWWKSEAKNYPSLAPLVKSNCAYVAQVWHQRDCLARLASLPILIETVYHLNMSMFFCFCQRIFEVSSYLLQCFFYDLLQ